MQIVIDMDIPTSCRDCYMMCADIKRNDTERPKDCPIKCDIEDIKAEIIQKNSLDYVEPISCEEVIEIIDKHTKGDKE